MEKLLFFDFETTGTNVYKSAPHQLAGAIVIDGVVKEEFDFKMRPFDGADISDEALEKSNVTLEQIMAYPDAREAYSQFVKLCDKYVNKYDKFDKFHLVGYNNRGFDDVLLRNLYLRYGNKFFGSYFWPDTIDCLVLASVVLRKRRAELENFQQGTVAKFLDINVDYTKLHNAKYDTQILINIYNLLTEEYIHTESKYSLRRS